MDFELHFILIVGACIMNLFLFWIASVGFFMLKEVLNEGSNDSLHVFFCCILIMASFGFQCFVLANWLKSFY